LRPLLQPRAPPHKSTLFPYTTLFRSQERIVFAPEDQRWNVETGEVRVSSREAEPVERPCEAEESRNAAFPSEWAEVDSDVFLTEDRKSTRLNSSHQIISYAVFCLKKK